MAHAGWCTPDNVCLVSPPHRSSQLNWLPPRGIVNAIYSKAPSEYLNVWGVVSLQCVGWEMLAQASTNSNVVSEILNAVCSKIHLSPNLSSVLHRLRSPT